MTEEAQVRVERSRAIVERIIANKETVYGITTGFGLFSDVLIDQQKYNQLQVNLIRSHAWYRCTFCIECFARDDDFTFKYFTERAFRRDDGISGSIGVFINQRIIPVIPQQGSLGASGDLAPLSHLALALIGEGKVEYQGEVLDSSEVLKQLNRKPLTLQAKEGLALINGTQAMTAQGVISWIETEKFGIPSRMDCRVNTSSVTWYYRCLS